MSASLSAAQLRELQRAIAHAAVDRLIAEQSLTPETNSMNHEENPTTSTNRGPDLITDSRSGAAPLGRSLRAQGAPPLRRTTEEAS